MSSSAAADRLLRIRSHLVPTESGVSAWGCSSSVATANNDSPSISPATASITYKQAPPSTVSSPKDELYEDEDESKYVYDELPADQRIPGNYTVRNVLARPRKFKLPNGTEIDISFRRYREGSASQGGDDDAFQRLDSECKQGKTGLETVFFHRLPWSSFQRNTECIVATPADNPNDIIATARGYRKWVYLNGRKAPLTYHFLLRVSPRFRSSGLGEFTERILLNNDYELGSRYILGYVLDDNEKSLALQKRILNNQDKLQVELKRWFVSGHSLEAIHLKLRKTREESNLKCTVRHMTGVKEQVEHTKKAFAGTQLLPCDLSNIFRSALSEGTYALYLDDSNGEKPSATFSVWNSGAVRSCRLPHMKTFLETPCMFYNFWYDPALSQEKGVEVLSILTSYVAEEIHRKNTHGFVYSFLMEDHPMAEILRESAEYFVAWRARLWYWDASFHHDPATGCDLAFDPRDALQ